MRRRVAEALLIALILRVPIRDLESEGDGLGVNPVRAANLRRVTKLLCPECKDVAEFREAALDKAGRVADEKRLRCVHDVVRRQAMVQPARR